MVPLYFPIVFPANATSGGIMSNANNRDAGRSGALDGHLNEEDVTTLKIGQDYTGEISMAYQSTGYQAGLSSQLRSLKISSPVSGG